MGGRNEGLFNGYEVSVLQNKNVLKMDNGVGLHNNVIVVEPLSCKLTYGHNGKLHAMCI